MAFGNNAYPMLQAEQQARAEQLAATPMSLPLQQRFRNSGILPMIGGGAMTAARGFDGFVLGGATGSMINSGRNFAWRHYRAPHSNGFSCISWRFG